MFSQFTLTGLTLVLSAQATFAQLDKPQTIYDIYKWAEVGGEGTSLNEDMKRKYFSIGDGFDSQLNCFTNEQKPSAPRSLSFCHKFNDNACCVPQLDDENNDFFGMLTNLGLSCRLRGDIREDALAKFYCLNCDPDQPTYVRVGASIDGMIESNGGTYSGDLHTADFADGEEFGRQTLLVSLNWAKEEFGENPLLAGRDNRLAKCGLLVSVPCEGDEGELDGRDRYMCGDDLVLPANSGYNIIQMDENGLYLVNESLFQFLNFPSLGTPMIDDGFAFHLVTDEPCETGSTGILDPSRYLNPHCPRTAEQIKTIKLEELDDKMTYRDWVCANINGDFNSSDLTQTESYCEGECTEIDETKCVEGTEDECKTYAKLLLSGGKKRCCCGFWHDEKVFNSASVFTYSINMLVALVLFVVFY